MELLKINPGEGSIASLYEELRNQKKIMYSSKIESREFHIARKIVYEITKELRVIKLEIRRR